jgi:Fe-S cluster biosynthesis and repair protein YggX
MVNCIKLGKTLPGLKAPPMPNELGKKIYEQVSEQAWKEFAEYFKMVINEYRLDLTSPQADTIFEQKIEEYFFSNTARMPEGYIPPEPQ